MVSVRYLGLCLAVVASAASTAASTNASEHNFLLLRAESLVVLPNSKPVLYVQVANVTDARLTATVTVHVPASWHMVRQSQVVELAGREQQRLGFPVAEGKEESSYPIEMVARSEGRQVIRRQNISVASAPYFKPTIDGDPSDWKDAIPVTFETGQKRTSIATYWNRRQFSLLVSVEETAHVRRGRASKFDAIQLVLAPRGTVSSRDEGEEAGRFEYVAFADREGVGRCCQLAAPETKLADTTRPRSLDELVDDQVAVVVKRVGIMTYYELSVPLARVRQTIKPSEGREFYLSVLVHDPDGTGLRDWGVAAGLWPRQRNRLAWSDWEGAQWGDVPPMDCRTEWGMCSSRY